jgi:hypothetical protein
VTTLTATPKVTPVVPSTAAVYERIEVGASSYEAVAAPAFDLDLEHSGDHWLVRDVPTGIFGAGASPADALDDFWRAAREHAEVLGGEARLTDALAAQLQYLRERIELA